MTYNAAKMIWFLFILIVPLALYASELRRKLKALEWQHDTSKVSTADLAAWFDLVAYKLLLIDYHWRLRADGISKSQSSRIKAERKALSKAFHARDSLREMSVTNRPLAYMPIALRDLYIETEARGYDQDKRL